MEMLDRLETQGCKDQRECLAVYHSPLRTESKDSLVTVGHQGL